MTLVVLVSPSLVNAQVVYSYQLVPQTVYEKQPVTVSRWVDETVMEKQVVIDDSREGDLVATVLELPPGEYALSIFKSQV